MRRACEQGLTLLELMVAMAIFSVIGTTIYSTFAATVQTRDYATERARHYAAARTALDRIEQDLRGSFDAGLRGTNVPPRLRAPAAEDASLGDDRVVLEMTTISARGVAAPEAFVDAPELAELARIARDRGDQAHVRWVLDEEGDLLRYEVRPVRAEAVDWTAVPYEIIAHDVELGLEFYDQTQWIAFWDSVEPGSQQHRAPALVRTRLESATSDQAPVVLVSSVVLPMAVEAAASRKNPLFPGGRKKESGKDRAGSGGEDDDED